MPWVGLQCVIVVFPNHTHLLFDYKIVKLNVNVFIYSAEEPFLKYCLHIHIL